MPQVLVLEAISGLERRSYAAGVVLSIADPEVVAWLKARRAVDDTASVVAAAIAGGARQLTHSAGAVASRKAVETDIDADTGLSVLVAGGRAVRTLAQRPRPSFVMTKCITGMWAAVARANTDVNCTHIQTVLEAGFDQVRIWIPNMAGAQPGFKVSVAVATAAGADNSAATIDPTLNGGVWLDLTAGGAAIGQPPVYASGGVVGWLAYDWGDLASLDQSNGDPLKVFHVRVEGVAGTTAYTLTNTAGGLAALETPDASGRFWRARTQAVAGVSNKAAFTDTSSAVQHIPVVIQYMSRAAGYSIFVCGDSRPDGQGADRPLNNAAERAAAALSRPDRPVSVCNMSIPGANSTAIAARWANTIGGVSIIKELACGYGVSLSDFVNDNAAAPLTAGEVGVMRKDLAKIRRISEAAGQRLFLGTAYPTPTRVSGASDDALRIAFSEESKAVHLAAGQPVWDIRSACVGGVNGSGAETWVANGSVDLLHPSELTHGTTGKALENGLRAEIG